MEYNIRKSVEGDNKSIYDLVCQLKEKPLDKNLFFEKYTKNLNNPLIEYWVLELNKNVIGFISIYENSLLHHNEIVFEIQEFVVDAPFRSKGYGTIFMGFILKKCDNKQIELTSNKSRLEAKRFYEKFGFENTHNKFIY